MMQLWFRQIPNILTTLRLLLAVPIALLITQQQFSAVLWLAFVAGVSDGLDGWLARKWHCQSRYGAVVDPLSDKAMLVGAYLSFAVIGLIPWWLAWLVLGRDVLIVVGALAYHGLFGRYEMAPSIWGKASTLVQISFALLLIAAQVWPVGPPSLLLPGLWLLVGLAVISGGHYLLLWGGKAWLQHR